jgi:hypothetical protein
MPEIQSYNLTGSYQFDGRNERQEGTIHRAPNGILYGEISDATARGQSPKRVMGMQFTEDGALGLLKLPKDLSLCPIIWYLRPLQKTSDGLGGKYNGVWGTAGGGSIGLLQKITTELGLLNLENIAGLNPAEIERAFFRRDVLNQMEPMARRAKQTGKITLSSLAR